MNIVELDSQQKLAVQTTSRRVLCLSGAGSGKTRVLTERIAYLIERQKVSPFETIALSFTRKASQEMRTVSVPVHLYSLTFTRIPTPYFP